MAPAAAEGLVIEQAIYFALGCIVTALGALMFAPVFWNRALRITRRRLQLQVPLSMQEIYAERDQLRADFAVERLRLEQELDRLRDGKTHDMAEAGRRSMEATRLADALAAAQRAEAGVGADLDGLKRVLAERDADLDALKRELRDSRDEAGRRRGDPAPADAPRGAAATGTVSASDDTTVRHVRSLEEALTTTRAALVEAREREKGLHLLHSLKSERERSADRTATERLDALEAENAALHNALRLARSEPARTAGTNDADLRESIHALGVAVAAMARDARRDEPRDHAAAAAANKDEVQAVD